MPTYQYGPHDLTMGDGRRSEAAPAETASCGVASRATSRANITIKRYRLAVMVPMLIAIGLLGCAAGDPARQPVSIYPASLPGTSSVYGAAVGADSLANSVVGGPSQTMVAYRFRATESAPLDGVTIYIQTGDGYSAGNGGTIRISVHGDDGSPQHVPVDTSMAMIDVPHPEVGAGNTYKFADPPQLIAGDLYHVVFTNTDPEPESNYVSVNGLFIRGDSRASQPGFPLADWANLVKSRDADWSGDRGDSQGTITPIMGLEYGNDESAGMGYMEVWLGDAKTISGSRKAREIFTVSGPDRTVTSFSVRLEREAGSSPLQVRLIDAHGQVIDKGAIPAQSISARDSSESGGLTWATLEFGAPRTLKSGESYEVVLSAPADTSYAIYAVRKGVIYGYGEGSYFSDGRGEFKDGSGWEALTPGWRGPGPEGDLQFFFEEIGSRPAVNVQTEIGGGPTAPASTGVLHESVTSEEGEVIQAICRERGSEETVGMVSDPTISGLSVARDGTSAVVEWSVDPPATGQVAYGPVDGSDSELLTTFEPSLLALHRQSVPSAGQPPLDPDVEYRFRVCSATGVDHVAVSR